MSQRCSAVLAEVSRTIENVITSLSRTSPGGASRPRLLDVGCWEGEATGRYTRLLGAEPHGIEVFPGPAARARDRGIAVVRLDLERDAFPWADATMDVVIANQVFEHLKNVWLPMSEIFRVLRPGGHLVFSVPNLASLHNRAMLAFGVQPSSIRTFGPHVRGYTYREARRFVELDGGLRIVRALGAGFYPFPARAASPLARAWPGASHTVVLLARKTRDGAGAPWQAYIEGSLADGLQTAYR